MAMAPGLKYNFLTFKNTSTFFNTDLYCWIFFHRICFLQKCYKESNFHLAEAEFLSFKSISTMEELRMLLSLAPSTPFLKVQLSDQRKLILASMTDTFKMRKMSMSLWLDVPFQNHSRYSFVSIVNSLLSFYCQICYFSW